MKRSIMGLVIPVIVIIVPVIAAAAEVIEFDTQGGQNGFELLNQNNSGISAEYSVSKIVLDDIEIDGQIMRNLYFSGIFLPNNAGAPNLPGEGRMIAIPQGSQAELVILSSRTEIVENVDLAPAPPIPFENDSKTMILLRYMQRIRRFTAPTRFTPRLPSCYRSRAK